MAIYRCEAKIISRGHGHSAVAAAAYRTGTKIRDEVSKRIHDYSGRKGVIESVILRPENSPEWSAQTASLWNTVELSEKRKDAQLSREFILAVPREISAQEQLQCAVGWAQSELVSKGMIVEVSLHHPKDGKNPHIHLLCTLRTIDGDKFNSKKSREWNDTEQLIHWRETWCNAENAALEKAGRPERVDHRSLKDQGIDRIPEPKLGKEAVGMKKRGVVEDPIRFQEVRAIRLLNELRPFMKAIQRTGEVIQKGLGNPAWEKSTASISRVRDRARKLLKSTWQRLVRSPREKTNKNTPEPEI